MPSWLRYPLTLAAIAAIAGGGLAFVEVATSERVKAQKKRKLSAAFKQVPGYKDNRELSTPEELKKKYDKDEKCFEVLGAGGELLAYAAQVKCVEPSCYNGTDPIVLVVVVDQALEKVLLVRSTQNKETPGLGTRVSKKAARKSLASMAGAEKVKPPERDYKFLDKFIDRSTDQLEIKKGDLDGITGATVSSKAVAGGARRAVEFLKAVTGK